MALVGVSVLDRRRDAPAFFSALGLLLRRGWVPMAFAGSHECEFCTLDAHRASANVLVPTEQLLYVAPAMIVHYMEEHAYSPPDEFVCAVLDCPAPGTEAYEARLKRFWGYWTDYVEPRGEPDPYRQGVRLPVEAAHRRCTEPAARMQRGARVRDESEAARWAERLHAAGAATQVWNGKRRRG